MQHFDDEEQAVQVFQRTKDSVVFVTQALQIAFTPQETIKQEGSGSGFIWDNQGHVVTNCHVVRHGHIGEIHVITSKKKEYKATLVGQDPKSDLAVLKIEELIRTEDDEHSSEDLKPIVKGSSQSLQVGQTVYAIGNPFGLHHTITSGIISGLERDLPGHEGWLSNLIQTDAPINPGNSGGPLLNKRGHLIGVTTAIVSPTGVSAGLGFAVPVDTVKEIIEQLIRNGRVIRPELGIVMLPDRYRLVLGVPFGVVVLYVKPNSPADRAGIQSMKKRRGRYVILGDVITGIAGQKIQKQEQLLKFLQTAKVGEEVEIEVVRGQHREKKIVRITLEEQKINSSL
jgi:S1-C subfamily serine protease